MISINKIINNFIQIRIFNNNIMKIMKILKEKFDNDKKTNKNKLK